MSDPYAIIRRLVKMVELMKEERRATQELHNSGSGGGWSGGVTPGKTVQVLQRELTELRVENANMFVLQEENRQLSGAAARAEKAEAEAAALRRENEQLKRDLEVSSEQLQAMHLSHLLAPTASSSPCP